MIKIHVPGWPDMELPEFYPQFKDYYPNCEMQTKGWMVQNVKSEWICLDCGANIGYFSILLSQLADQGEVHAFEPTSTMDMLIKNIAHNKCDTNIYLNRIAIGKHNGEFTETIYKIWGETPEIMTYNFTTIDQYTQVLNLERLDLIKIDEDSFDLEALMGAVDTLKKYCPVVIVELNDALKLRGYTVQDALNFMDEQEYEVTAILDGENYVMRRK